MQHELVLVRPVQGLDQCRVAQRPQRRRHDRLRLAAREHRRPVGSRKQSDIDRNRPHGSAVTPVDARLAGQHALAHDVLLQSPELREHRPSVRIRFAPRGDFGHGLPPHGADPGLSLLLVRDAVGVAQGLAHCPRDALRKLRIRRRGRPFPLRLARLRGQLLDGPDRDLHLLVRKQDAAEHLVLGQFVRLRLDHQHGGSRAGDHHVERRRGKGLHARIQQVRTVDVSHPRRADRPAERGARQRQRRGRADHRDDVRIHVLLDRHHLADDLDFVHEALGKQRPDGPVDKPAGQRLLLGRAPFAPGEAAGDLADRVHLLFVVDRQGEEPLVGTRLGHDHRRAEHDRVAHRRQYTTGGLPGHAIRLQDDLVAAELEFLSD